MNEMSDKNENDDQEGCYCPILHTLCDYNYDEDCQEGCMQLLIKELLKEQEDLEDFVFEQEQYYEEHPHKFYTSFYKTCSEMLQAGCDLSNKQMVIVEREKRIKGA